MISDDYFNTSHINEYMTDNTLTNFGTNLKVFYRRNIEKFHFEQYGKIEFQAILAFDDLLIKTILIGFFLIRITCT